MCVTILSDFVKPVKFEGYPLIVSVLDDQFEGEGIYNLDISNATAQAQPTKYAFNNCNVKYPIHLYWKNKKGGVDSYLFNWKHAYSQDVNGGVTYKDDAFIKRYATRGESIPKVAVQSGILPDFETYQAVFNILDAIQVWEWKGSQKTPVVIEEGSFPNYRVDQRFFDISFTIQYAPKLIQKQ